MTKPFVSVLIPVYNVATYLEQCLESVVHQDMQELEIICVNDGSTDASPEILQRYAEKYSHIKLINRSNGGYGSAVNLALSHATGEYVAILEPDDYIAEDMYSSLYAHACKHNKPDIVKGGWWDVIEEPQLKLTRKPDKPAKIETPFTVHEFPEILIWHPSIWSSLYKRDFLNAAGIRMVEAKGAGWVDNPFMFQAYCEANSICFLNKPLYYYRCFSINSSSVLKDCSIPISRMNEIFDYIRRKKIREPEIIKQAYVRALIYVRTLSTNPNVTPENTKALRKLIARMHRPIVLRITPYWYQWYNKHCGYFSRIPRPGSKYANELRKLPPLIRRAPQIIKNNGVKGTAKKLIQKIRSKL
ncbi:MAG: glycosyltransferase family 2 protein [Clostridia bacterium]|nr:glycosyltransferase family 2 protein [Clostridia bacterium]